MELTNVDVGQHLALHSAEKRLKRRKESSSSEELQMRLWLVQKAQTSSTNEYLALNIHNIVISRSSRISGRVIFRLRLPCLASGSLLNTYI